MAGNWKMYKNPAATAKFFDAFRPLVAGASHCEVVLCPTYTCLAAAVECARGSAIGVGAQNAHPAAEGAFTGEVSAAMVRALGCSHVILGHSERRQFFGETDAGVFQRAAAAVEAGLAPIVCIGERLEEREGGRTEAVLAEQFRGSMGGLSAAQFAASVIAYEPVWAIGTGKTATPEMAAETHRLIRAEAARAFGKDAAANVRILYGGSVKPDNVKSLMAQPEIDGVLVGGASLDPVSFASIVNF
jgi:triosephosphate isomerase (TIM)